MQKHQLFPVSSAEIHDVLIFKFAMVACAFGGSLILYAVL